MRIRRNSFMLCLVVSLFACQQKQDTHIYKIGFSQCTGGDAWRRQMLEAMYAELVFHPGYTLAYRDARNSTTQQLEDIAHFIDEKVDILIITPNEAQPVTASVENARAAGIPVILVDRKINSDNYTAYIGADNYEIGKQAASYIASVAEEAAILEVRGLSGSSPAIDRHRGFTDELKHHTQLHIVAAIDGKWEADTAAAQFKKSLSSLPSFDVVFAHNDVMAQAIYTICREQNIAPNARYIGVDGLLGKNGGMELVENKILDATFLYPTGGEESIRLAAHILQHEPYERENILQTARIDSKDVSIMKQQRTKIAEQQHDLTRLQAKMNADIQRYADQQNFIYILIAGIVSITAIGITAVIHWKKKQNAYRELNTKNRELQAISDELAAFNEELRSTNEKLEEAQAKIQEQTDIILRQQDEQLNRVLDASNDVIWSFDLTGNNRHYISRSAEILFGDAITNDMLNNPEYWLERTHEDDRAIREEARRQLQNTGYSESTFRLKMANGIYIWIFERVRYVYDAEHKPVREEGVAIDLTRQRADEDMILRYQQQLEIIFSNTQEQIALLDLEGKLLLFNRSFEEFTEEAVGQKPKAGIYIGDITTEENKAAVHRLFHEALQGNFIKTTARYTLPSGNMYLSLRYEPVMKDGVIRNVAIIAFDITQQKEQENIIRESEANLKAIFNNTRDSFTLLSPDYKIVAFNRANFQNTLLRARRELRIGNDLFDYIQDERKVTFLQMLDRVEHGETVSYEVHMREDGIEAAWFNVTISQVLSSDEKFMGYCIEARNITEQKEFEGAITAIARELSNLIEHANVPIFGTDQLGNINEWNRVAFELTGYSRIEMIGREWIAALLEEEYREVVKVILNDALQGTPISNFELPLLTRKNRKLILLLSIAPRRDVDNNIIGVIVVGQNITELIEYKQNLERMVYDRTRELNEALQKEKDLVEMKSKFVSIASHEFRTPLSSISLASGFIKKYKQRISPDEIDKRLENIEKQVGHMTHLLDDVLMIGKTEAGKMQVHLAQVNLVQALEKLKLEVEQSTRNTHSIELQIYGADTPIHMDEKLIRTIVINLLTNAIKFSPATDTIELTVTGEEKKLTIQVKDYGIGIPERDVKNLFEPFYRASNANDIEGTGLGLSIIKKAVDLLRGYIDVKSKVGKGTEITIVIPLPYA
ncbi:MAG TPA: PAS domain S-box protein [Ohtaekwangia sp.]|uniref:PAS domain S-box protein n=1 Tax=Ohtaekwangia sp. TaxID=2066019 RepID=UPI002F955CE9